MALASNERPGRPIAKFESMLKTNDVYFFDAEDFEDIIHHYLNNGKISLAKKAIRIALQQHPGNLELKLLDIEVLVFENHFERAELMLDELQLMYHNNEEIYIQKANIHSKKDNHPAAVALLQKALEISEDNLDIHSLLGMEYLFMDDFEAAKLHFEKCVAFDLEDYASLYNVIYCYEFLDDHEGAIAYLNNYLDKNPYCEVAWHQLGKQYAEKEMYRQALAAFDFAIISDDTFVGAYFEKGKVLEKMEEYERAIENYEATMEMDDPTSHAYLRIGRCHERLGHDDMAKKYYNRTVHEDPLLDKGWLAITNFHFRKGNYEKAIECIDRAINIDGENPVYWKRCGKIHYKLKNWHEADYAYKRSVDLGNYELDTWLEWATVLYKGGEAGTGLTVLLQGIEFHPERAELQYLMAGMSYRLNDAERAKKHLKKGLELNREKLSFFSASFPDVYPMPSVQRLVASTKNTSE